MSFWSRLKVIFGAKANRALDRAEKPDEILDYSYDKQVEALQQMRAGIADVATSRKRIELQAQQLVNSVAKLEDQAKQALGAGREDLAREALTRKAAASKELGDLQAQHEQLKAQEDSLVASSRQLESKIQAFRTKKETIKAQYAAAEAQARVAEAASGVSADMRELGAAVQRAEDRVAQMQARAAALDELTRTGALEGSSATTDRIQAELDSLSVSSEVDREMERLRGELGSAAPREPQSEVTVGEPGEEAGAKPDAPA
jgi:phage shock protein A